MALQAKVIKQKIGSVKNIRKITRAMEMVAATKMRRATVAVLNSKEYVVRAYELMQNLSNNKGLSHELLEAPKDATKVLVVGISSNRGLCGGFNTNIRRAVASYIKDSKDDVATIAVGKYMERTMNSSGKELLASFTSLGDTITEEDIWAINSLIISEYKKGIYKKVVLFYTRFNSSLSYTPLSKEILPVRQEQVKKTIDEIEGMESEVKVESFDNFVFEPDQESILDFVLPRVTEVYLYQSLLESLASEHSSRMVAMKSASDNAKKLVDELNVGYNRARQAAITQEIAEISAGASN